MLLELQVHLFSDLPNQLAFDFAFNVRSMFFNVGQSEKESLAAGCDALQLLRRLVFELIANELLHILHARILLLVLVTNLTAHRVDLSCRIFLTRIL